MLGTPLQQNGSYLLDSATVNLITFVEKHLPLLRANYSADTECIAARYALYQKMRACDRQIQVFSAIINDPAVTPDIKIQASRQLAAQADEMVKIASMVTRTLKTAAEIQVLSGTHFDGVQMFHLISQIPTILTESLNSLIKNFIVEMLDKVERTSVRATRITLELELAEFIKQLVTDLTNTLQSEVQVLQKTNNTVSPVAIEQQVLEMQNLIPSG